MRERRRYVRSNGLVLIDYKGSQIEGKSSAFDVSGVGVRLTIDKELKVASSVKLEIYVPSDSQPIKAEGEVIWVQKRKEQAKAQVEQKKEFFYTGIKFTSLDENNRAKIIKYVYKRLH